MRAGRGRNRRQPIGLSFGTNLNIRYGTFGEPLHLFCHVCVGLPESGQSLVESLSEIRNFEFPGQSFFFHRINAPLYKQTQYYSYIAILPLEQKAIASCAGAITSILCCKTTVYCGHTENNSSDEFYN
jgi:hypothetical protein